MRHLVDETIDPANQRIILKIVGFLVYGQFGQSYMHRTLYFCMQEFECATPEE